MKKILLTFTYGVSLRTWREQGLLDRELALYKKMAKGGYKIGLLTYGDNSDLKLKDAAESLNIYPIYSYMNKPRAGLLQFLLSFLVPFKLAFVFRDYDIYKTNQMRGAWVAVIAKVLYGKKLIIRCGYEWMRILLGDSRGLKKIFVCLMLPFIYLFELLAYSYADKIILSSPGNADFVKRVFIQPAGKLIHIYNYVDINNFKKLNRAKPYSNRILYIGRLHWRKNLANLLDAVDMSNQGLGLDIIGSPDGAYHKKIYKHIKRRNVDARFLGAIGHSKLPLYINRYPVFALMSYFEHNPKSLLEAMACERVVVGSDKEGINNLIKDGVSGILASTDTEGIKRGLERAFGLTDDKKAFLGTHAKEFVAGNCSLEAVYEKEKKCILVL